MKYLKLPFTFDAARLQRDAAKVAPDEWKSHFNQHYYEGDWSGVALRSVGGGVKQLFSHPLATLEEYIDTPLMARCEALREAADRFACDKQSVRLLRLGARSRILEHFDPGLDLESGLARIHIPITTSPEVGFYLDGERVVMREGESWYLDFSLPHRIENTGDTPRIHLVIDCRVNEWLEEVLGAAARRGC